MVLADLHNTMAQSLVVLADLHHTMAQSPLMLADLHHTMAQSPLVLADLHHTMLQSPAVLADFHHMAQNTMALSAEIPERTPELDGASGARTLLESLFACVCKCELETFNRVQFELESTVVSTLKLKIKKKNK